ncbi:unnamed protein product [Psylliodes chrysocephalus]|uniref:RING-type domain-containing protein n=1 Tax=Psylliodes chrysocephalus TaxID=3402493 RepID=A0A9P0DF36_9CUCU|nr:unnamed protein product [Psylliodes chrysocephala]
MMERLSDDAENIQRLLPWIGNKEDIVNFIRKIPIDHSHLRIPLSISYFFKLRDQSEENYEQNIENDAREIVILLPDTPYNLIKSRLKDLGNIPNRKEVLVKQLISERSELKWILQEIDLNGVRKRSNENLVALDNQQDNETNIKIKIRKIDGSLEVVSSIKQEILPSSKKINGSPELLRQRSLEGDTASASTSNHLPELTSNHLPELIVSNSTQPTSSDSNNWSHFAYLNGQLSSTSKVSEINMQTDAPSEVPTTFNLVEYLKDVSQCSEEKIHHVCKNLCVSTSKRPPDSTLNLILNRLIDESVIELDDSDVGTDSSLGSSNEDLYNVTFPKPMNNEVVITKDNVSKVVFPKPILRPATLLAGSSNGNNAAPSRPVHHQNIIQPARLNIGNAKRTNTFLDVEDFFNNIKERNNNEDQASASSSSVKEETKDPWYVYDIPPLYPNDFGEIHHPEGSKETVPPPVDPPVPVAPTGLVVPKETLINLINQEEVVNAPEEAQVQPGPSKVQRSPKQLPYDENLVLRIIEMFPQACPDYIRGICRGKSFQQLDDVVTVILSEESYPQRPQKSASPAREYDIEDQLEIVKALLPDADPTYLRWKCESIGNNSDQLNEFINEARESKSYPTKKEYLRKQKLSAQSRQYTSEFSVEKFVELFPDPEKTFRDPTRSYAVEGYAHLYICTFFQNRYDKLAIKYVRSILSENKNRILFCDDVMKDYIKRGLVIKTRRKQVILQDPPQNIAVLQELAYVAHKEEIENYIKETKEKEENEKRLAKENGLLNTCQCCYDDEVMPKDTFYCPKDCTFCKSCIQKSCEVTLGDGKTDFKCLNHCTEEFSLLTLQKVLPPKMFSKLAQKKALAEVKAAGIEELESCPFCDFASIPNISDKIFRCLNPDCMKESCRLCKEENHVPYKCDEVEKDEDVKARVFVENQMTEALLRKCWKCDKSFFKEEGCNKMTCTCGARMCYICKQPVTDYTHFNGIGGDKFNLCPLYSDTNEFNQKNVIAAATEAKAKVDPTKLKIDPSLDVQEHYETRKKQLPPEPHIRLLEDMRQQQNQLIHQHQLHPQHHHPQHHRHQHHRHQMVAQQRPAQRAAQRVANHRHIVRHRGADDDLARQLGLGIARLERLAARLPARAPPQNQ